MGWLLALLNAEFIMVDINRLPLNSSVNKIRQTNMKPLAKFLLVFTVILTGCTDKSVIYEDQSDLEQPYKIKLHEVKIITETNDSLTVDFIYTYEHDVPANEIKLFVMPDHGYWSTRDVKISKGKHGARAVIGLSKRNMNKDNVTESETTKLRFRFDHYLPRKYLGNIWGHDVVFHKKWKQSN